MKILVTAFEPFNGSEGNRSEISVERVAINLNNLKFSNGKTILAEILTLAGNKWEA